MILDAQQLMKTHLTDAFILASKRNPRFSLRAFAKKLGISNAALSELMRGKRTLSKKKALDIAKHLGLPEDKLKTLSDAFDKAMSLEKLRPVPNPLKEVIVEPRQFKMMADWRYFAVLALVRTNGHRLKSKDIAAMLDISVDEVGEIIEEMVDLGVIIRQTGGALKSENVVFRTSENFPESLMKERRLQSLSGASKAMQIEGVVELGSFATVSTNPEQIREAQDLIEDFVKRLCLYLRNPKSEHVYELNVNLFPRTKM
jgi:uncharacterized protein (TIGR02147 family)